MITPEELAAYADGELTEKRTAEIAAIVEDDPQLAKQVVAHQALKHQLGAHFAPILEQDVPDRLTAPLRAEADVVELPTAKASQAFRAANDDSPSLKRWGWIAGPALAASLAIAVFLPRGGEGPESYADAQLASALDSQLVASQSGDPQTRILLSFKNTDGEFCRAYSADNISGIACRDASGWQLRHRSGASEQQATQFRQAGNEQADLMAVVQDMAAGPALDADEEAAARDTGWQ